MSELDKIRSVFPSWPSELDVAKSSGNWAMQAQAFFSAAVILDEEANSAHHLIDTDAEGQVRTGLLMRVQTYIPSIFCLAFAIELATKAALVHQGKLAGMHHSLLELARQIDDFTIDHATESVFQWATSVVRDGKYPTSKKQSDMQNGVRTTVLFRDLVDNARPVYNRLMSICAKSASSG